jgi:hypothetical protein
MANLTDKLMQLRDELQADRDQNVITNEGEVLLRNLESGVATQSIGAALQGLTLNLSDEGNRLGEVLSSRMFQHKPLGWLAKLE